ncbi:hypothetical protein B0T24DRAFT_596004 [Lasiosphaeria ovina]|uniref:Uncharacterized protein n=1 Tax=Lasiosphaeria ovina TaxID=92902 RepID=A0AAE0N4K4_9PEZI|nr:hypothetical protein B0T24DRAFT_596004 [Lasiosphaeria ovina]
MQLPLPASVMAVLCVAGTASPSPPGPSPPQATDPGAYHVGTIVLFAERMINPLVFTLNLDPTARAVAADFERMHNLTDVSVAMPCMLAPQPQPQPQPQPFDGDELLDYVIWPMCCPLDRPADVWTGGPIKRAAFPFSLGHVFVSTRADPPNVKRPVDRGRARALLRAWRGATARCRSVPSTWRARPSTRTSSRGSPGRTRAPCSAGASGSIGRRSVFRLREFTEDDARQVLLLATFILIEVLPWLLPLL